MKNWSHRHFPQPCAKNPRTAAQPTPIFTTLGCAPLSDSYRHDGKAEQEGEEGSSPWLGLHRAQAVSLLHPLTSRGSQSVPANAMADRNWSVRGKKEIWFNTWLAGLVQTSRVWPLAVYLSTVQLWEKFPCDSYHTKLKAWLHQNSFAKYLWFLL